MVFVAELRVGAWGRAALIHGRNHGSILRVHVGLQGGTNEIAEQLRSLPASCCAELLHVSLLLSHSPFPIQVRAKEDQLQSFSILDQLIQLHKQTLVLQVNHDNCMLFFVLAL